MIVCFFGHKDTPEAIRPALQQEIERLIGCGADDFLVGSQGGFDAMVLECLRKLAEHHRISYSVVLAYMPKPGEERFQSGETMLPEGMELIHPKYAIAHRNKWMVEVSDVAVVYVAHGWGGAAKYMTMAERKGKEIINLFEKYR